jgi:phosphatidylserine decarboxylase
MTIHKEGRSLLLITFVAVALISWAAVRFLPTPWSCTVATIGGLVFIIILQFFRSPSRNWVIDENAIIAPADGKVVVIEEVYEPEFYKENRLQVSIFMSPINVHVNRNPIAGIVKYFKYHPGLFLVAWHPKASTDNERTTIVLEHKNGKSLLMRQIAGALAKRIVWYVKENDQVEQTNEYGFIKFGSRVDLFLPIGTKVLVNIDEKTKGGITKIAQWN